MIQSTRYSFINEWRGFLISVWRNKMNSDKFSSEMMTDLKFGIVQSRNISLVSLMIFFTKSEIVWNSLENGWFLKVKPKNEIHRMAAEYAKKFKFQKAIYHQTLMVLLLPKRLKDILFLKSFNKYQQLSWTNAIKRI